MAGSINALYQLHPELRSGESDAVADGANANTERFSNEVQLRRPDLYELRRRQLDLSSGVLSVIPDDILPTQSSPQPTNPPQKPSSGGDNDNSPRRDDDTRGIPGSARTGSARTTDEVTEPTRSVARSTVNRDSKQTDKPSSMSEESDTKTSKSGGQTDRPKGPSPTTTTPQTTADSAASNTPTTESSTESSTPIASVTRSSTEPSQTSSSQVSSSVITVEVSTTTSPSSNPSRSSSTAPNLIMASIAPSSTAKPSSASPFKSPISETGIIIASVSATAVLIGIILLIIFCIRRRKQRRLIVKNLNEEMYLEKQLEENSVGGIRKTTSGLGVVERTSEPITQVNRAFSSPAAAPWQPPTEQHSAIPSPVAMHPPSAASWRAPTPDQATVPSPAPIHPPGSYTRHPRTSRLRSSSLRSGEVSNHQRPLSQQGVHSNQYNEDLIRRSNSVPLRTSYDNFPSIPPPSIQPPPTSLHHQPQPQPQQSYQAYRPFASRYQVPNTIPEEDTGENQYPPRGSRPYFPGERTRSPQIENGLPASLVVGRGNG